MSVWCGWLALGSVFTACGDSQNSASSTGGKLPDAAAVVNCTVTAPTACPSPAPHYADVQPIFQQRCLGCHSGGTQQWPLTTYQDIADWNDTVRDDVLSCAMPPPDSSSAITNAERVAILTWLRCGYLQ